MTLQQKREYYALRAKLEVCISDLHDEFLIDLLKTPITPELSDIIIEELKTRAQRLTDAVAGATDDIPVGNEQLWEEAAKMWQEFFKPFNSK
jgi:FtsZ-binding cell division protein ZapB